MATARLFVWFSSVFCIGSTEDDVLYALDTNVVAIVSDSQLFFHAPTITFIRIPWDIWARFTFIYSYMRPLVVVCHLCHFVLLLFSCLSSATV